MTWLLCTDSTGRWRVVVEVTELAVTWQQWGVSKGCGEVLGDVPGRVFPAWGLPCCFHPSCCQEQGGVASLVLAAAVTVLVAGTAATAAVVTSSGEGML